LREPIADEDATWTLDAGMVSWRIHRGRGN
jgi:hypothetical protein